MNPTVRRLAALAIGLAVAGCGSDRTSAPSTLDHPLLRSNDLLGGVVNTATSALNLTPVVGLKRTAALPAPITVTQVIGSAGGTLRIPEAGVTVTVPAGALASPTTISMTALAGSLVAYDFAPHGITFARPLEFSQSLSGTNASLLSVPSLKLGYYPDDSLLSGTGALVSELIDGSVDLLGWRFNARIPHFSGYILSCGRADE